MGGCKGGVEGGARLQGARQGKASELSPHPEWRSAWYFGLGGEFLQGSVLEGVCGARCPCTREGPGQRGLQ